MMKKVTARRMGGSVGATLPKDMVERLSIRPGDDLFVIEKEDGILLTPYDPSFDEVMAAYERFKRKYRNALKTLAES